MQTNQLALISLLVLRRYSWPSLSISCYYCDDVTMRSVFWLLRRPSLSIPCYYFDDVAMPMCGHYVLERAKVLYAA